MVRWNHSVEGLITIKKERTGNIQIERANDSKGHINSVDLICKQVYPVPIPIIMQCLPIYSLLKYLGSLLTLQQLH